jgi:hypothetical protein
VYGKALNLSSSSSSPRQSSDQLLQDPLFNLNSVHPPLPPPQKKKLNQMSETSIGETDSREMVLGYMEAIAMQMRIQYKCPIYVFPAMKLAALLFPKHNCKVLFPNFHIHVSVSDLFITKSDQSWEYINRSQIHE